ncbi:MAG TPA: hypothetical protein VHN36_12375, partial [Ilumatobacteraceae bacterium]|nr:hypothetical protein [Ilumatobacteraceae bacterium]
RRPPRRPPPPVMSVAVVVGVSGVVVHGTTGAFAMVVGVVGVVVVVVVSLGVVLAEVPGVLSGVVSGTVAMVDVGIEESVGAVVVVAEQSSKAEASFTGSGVDDPVVLAELFDVGVLAELEGVVLELVWPSIR